MRHLNEIEKAKETGQDDRLLALARIMIYSADEAGKIGVPFVTYCANLARDSIVAELGRRGAAIPKEPGREAAAIPSADRAAIGCH